MSIDASIIARLDNAPVFDSSKIVNLINQGQQRRIQQETHAQQMQLDNQRLAAGERTARAAELQLGEDAISRSALQESGGDMDKYVELVRQRAKSPATIQAAQTHQQAIVKGALANQKEQGGITDAKNERMAGLLDQVSKLKKENPEAYAQAFPQIHADIKAIDPETASHLDPNDPESLHPEAFGLHFASLKWGKQAAEAVQAEAKRKEEAADAQHKREMDPFQLADAKGKADQTMREGTASTLAAAQEQGRLGEALANLSPEQQQVFGSLPANAKPADILRMGMNPSQQAAAITAATNAENNVSDAELDLRSAKGDAIAKKTVDARHARKLQEIAAGRDPSVRLDREIGQYGKPFDEIVKGVDSQLDKVLDAEKMLAGGAVSQALGIPKILTALVSGQGSGVRITQAELNSIANARGLTGNVEGFFSKLSGNGTLTSAQKKQMQGILEDVRTRIVEKKSIARQVGEDMAAATDRTGVLAAASKGRAALDAHSAKGSGPQKGDVQKHQGHDYKFDGSQWVLQ